MGQGRVTIVTRPPPTKEQWLLLRREIAVWYLQKLRTAGWITKELRARGLMVTTKMLRDRFREWNFPLKYNRNGRGDTLADGNANVNNDEHPQQRHQLVRGQSHRLGLSGSMLEDQVQNGPASPLNTAPEETHLTSTLFVTGQFLDILSGTGSWRTANLQQGTEMQRLAATAHMTIGTFNSDCPARYSELLELGSQVTAAMSGCRDIKNMHPRVLTALLRLLVDNCPTKSESEALAIVKRMFQAVADQQLQPQHPVRLLCRTNAKAAPVLLQRLLLLVQTRFYDKISQDSPVFAAQEQVYGARVLASIGRGREAIALIDKMLAKFEDKVDRFTVADANRTLGYAELQVGSLDEARLHSIRALSGFEELRQGKSDSAMYTNLTLASLYGRSDLLRDLVAAENHASAALDIWKSNADSNGGRGGIKLVKDLHQILCRQDKMAEAEALRGEYPTYFSEDQEA